MGWWDAFTGWLGSFMPSLPSMPSSPRHLLVESVSKELAHPTTAKLITQQYFDWLSVVFWFAVFIVPFEFIGRIVRAVYSSKPMEEVFELFKSLLVIFVLFTSLPAILLGAKTLFDLIGQWFMFLAVGGAGADALAERLNKLSGHAELDFFLGIVQTVFLFELRLILYAVLAALFATIIVGVGGFILRWVPGTGPVLWGFAKHFVIWSITSSMVLMLVLAMSFGTSDIVFGSDATAGAFLTTTALYACHRFAKAVFRNVKAEATEVAKATKQQISNWREGTSDSPPSSEAPPQPNSRQRRITSILPWRDRQLSRSQDGVQDGDSNTPQDRQNEQHPSSTTQRSRPDTPPPRRQLSDKKEDEGINHPDDDLSRVEHVEQPAPIHRPVNRRQAEGERAPHELPTNGSPRRRDKSVDEDGSLPQPAHTSRQRNGGRSQ